MKRRNLISARIEPRAAARPTGWLAVALVLAASTAPSLAQTNPAPPPSAANVTAVPNSAAPPTPQAAPSPTAPTGLALPPQPPPPALPGAAPEQRGFLNGFGAWWNKSIADWKAKMKDQQTKLDAMNKQSADAAKDAATATQKALKSAADAMMPSHVIDIHQTCPVAGNGAADCATAAITVCKSKGYSDGQPLDVRTADKCSDSLWVSGQTPTAADCPVETTLLRAACR
ncbi:MAG TPA: hypothetical protein VHY10_02130 [Xanthobacteraceae bacterium]|nr:hypothetical protein [Xanthobacteraceae bacterium]